MRLALSLAAALALPAAAQEAEAAPEPTLLSPMVMTTPGSEGVPGIQDRSLVEAGTYKVDPGHTLVTFTVDHIGFSSYTGQFGNPSGTLVLDPADPTAATVEVSFPIDGVSTTSEKLDEHLMSADFFDAENHPAATFKSTEIAVQDNYAGIRGDLTLRGVTKSVVLQAAFYGAGESPMGGDKTIGFRATTTINRSDFGIEYALPVVSDEVLLVIDAAFVRTGDLPAADADSAE